VTPARRPSATIWPTPILAARKRLDLGVNKARIATPSTFPPGPSASRRCRLPAAHIGLRVEVEARDGWNISLPAVSTTRGPMRCIDSILGGRQLYRNTGRSLKIVFQFPYLINRVSIRARHQAVCSRAAEQRFPKLKCDLIRRERRISIF
jgi:hypothetical protein